MLLQLKLLSNLSDHENNGAAEHEVTHNALPSLPATASVPTLGGSEDTCDYYFSGII